MLRMLRILVFTFMSMIRFPHPALSYDVSAAKVKYRYFDDYLMHLDRRDLTSYGPEIEGSGEISPQPLDEISSLLSKPLPIRTGSQRSKEVTCCMLGQLAGDKGYHCFVKFYAARLMHRNYNRAHNKKIAGLLPRNSASAARSSSEKLMRSFQQCVTTPRGVVFHKCCHLAAMESIPDNRIRSKLSFQKASRRH